MSADAISGEINLVLMRRWRRRTNYLPVQLRRRSVVQKAVIPLHSLPVLSSEKFYRTTLC